MTLDTIVLLEGAATQRNRYAGARFGSLLSMGFTRAGFLPIPSILSR